MKPYIIITMLVGLVACHNHVTEKHNKTESLHEDEIVLSSEQARIVGLETETVQTENFEQVIRCSGQILSAQGDEASVIATVAGIVSFAEKRLSEGSAIKANEGIAVISAKNLPEGDPIANTRAVYETALKEYQRAQNLIQDKIISEKEFEQIRLRYQTAQIAYQAQASNTISAGVRVISPISGFIKNLLVAQGDYVSVGQTIATVSQNKRLQLKAEVPEKYFNQLKNISGANFKPSYSETVFKLSEMNGRLLSTAKTTGGISGYLPVTFEFDNVEDIVPGTFAEVYLLALQKNNVISIPKTAITEEQGLYFVYLQIDEEGYKKQEITYGGDNGERVEILSGLTNGDQVVVKGTYQLKLAASSGTIPEAHTH